MDQGIIYLFIQRDIITISFLKKVYKLHAWIEKHPRVIHSPNVSDSLVFKINGMHVKKQKHILQISVRELHNDMILPIFQGGVLVHELLM